MEHEEKPTYEPPRVEDLGTLEEITKTGQNFGDVEAADLKT